MSKITFEELMSEVEKLKKLSTKQLSEEQKQLVLVVDYQMLLIVKY